MDKDYLELLQFLKKLGLEDISKTEKRALYTRLKNGTNLENLKKELEVLYSLNRVLIDSYTSVSLANMLKINNDIDSNLLVKLYMLYSSIKSKGLSRIDTIRQFKSLSYDILLENKNTNLQIQSLVKSTITQLQMQKESLYLIMLDKNKADALINNCYKRARLSLQKCQISNLENVVWCLKNNFSLTDDELVKISSQCGTLFALSSASKLVNLNKTLNDFKNYISNQLKITNKSIAASKLLDKSFKEILTTSGTLANADTKTLEDMIRFLKGEELGLVSKNALGVMSKLKGNFTPGQLAKIYSKSITSLDTSVNKIADSCLNIYEAYAKHYGVNLSLDNFVNGRNFVSLTTLRKEDYQENGKIDKIFEMLSPFITKSNMKNLLENNFGFLRASVLEVKLGIQEAILESKNNDELQRNLLKRIRGQFSRNVGSYVNVNRESSIIVDKSKQIKINDMQEDDILDVLKKLETSEKEIEEWKNSWNKEDKEIRNLQVQIDLEDFLAQLEDLKEIGNIGFATLETYIEEIDIIKSLYRDIVNKYNEILASNRLNKNLKEISSKVEKAIDEVAFIINKDIDHVINEYSLMIKGVNEELEKVNVSKSRYTNLDQRIKSLEDEILAKGISKEVLDQDKKKIEQLYAFISQNQVEFEYTLSQEKLADASTNTLYDLLFEKEQRSVGNDPMSIVNNKYLSAYYMFKLYANILFRDGLVFASDEVEGLEEVEPEDENMPYSEYRLYLDDDAREIADTVYEIYSENTTIRDNIYKNLLSRLEKYNVDFTGLNSIKKCISALHKIRVKLANENTQNINLLQAKTSLIKQREALNILEIENEIKKLEISISEYEKEISKWNDLKIK